MSIFDTYVKAVEALLPWVTAAFFGLAAIFFVGCIRELIRLRRLDKEERENV